MIPVRLEIKNFLPYRSPDTLRFEGVHLACLTGPNGAGKSSLLDAITWALWGKARAKRDEELIHLGQGDMHIQLDFEQEGLMYRVLRRRARGKRGQGTLDLFVLAGDGAITTLTAESMRATQARIDELLRLDYETFVHSAFLQQGRADAFTTKNPSERKRILADILGLDRWNKYEDAAKARLKAIDAQLIGYEAQIISIDEELARRPALQADLEAARADYAEAQATLGAAEERLKEVEHAPRELRTAQENKSERERRLREHVTDLEGVQERIANQQKQIAGHEEIIAMKADITAGYAALKSARETDRSLSDKLIELRTLDNDLYDLRSQLDNARTRLESEAEGSRKRISELESETQTDYSGDLESVQDESAQLQARQAERDRLDTQMNDLREERAGLETQQKTLTEEGLTLNDRLERLVKSDDDEAACPLCGQPLDDAHRTELIEQIKPEVEAKRDIYRQNKARITSMKTEIDDLRKQIAAIDIELKRLPAVLERAGKLREQVDSVEAARIQLKEERAALEDIESRLANESYAEEVREALAQIEAQRAELGYDKSSHDVAREQLEQHNEYERLHQQLNIAENSLPALQSDLESTQQREIRLNQAKDELESDIETLASEIIRLGELVKEYNARDDEVRALRTTERTANERVIAAEQQLKALDAQEKRKASLENQRDDARQEKAIYDELRRAFGKNGVPAMIIETAIPELETTANNLLSRMTDGRMHLRMNTQKEKVTGGTAETLDIEIADELGTRSYELYSGGEAFRINFAIRVALSQMLARRAGANLRTLFIDEGFGTQDEGGRNKLVEAINAIQEDFSLILVITHIDELRDSFPVHIVVDKTDSGSRINIR